MKYDFVEIGTSDFETCIQTAGDDTRGLSVEPIKYYLDQLPNPPGVKKLCCAVSPNNVRSSIDVYYVPADVVEQQNLPHWLRGCNCVGEYHLQHQKLNVKHLVTIESVPCVPIGEIFEKEQITELDLLKIDTEGNDCVIMLHFAEWLKTQPTSCRPQKINFESNELSDQHQVQQVIQIYKNFGYRVIYSLRETLLEISST
jgi:hypothetical protein